MSHHSQQSKSSLFIGDLAIFCTEEDIRRAFSAYGEVTEVKIIKSEETSRNLSYGFITFSTMEAAFEALNRLNGQLLCGRPMRINWASYRSKSHGPATSFVASAQPSPAHAPPTSAGPGPGGHSGHSGHSAAGPASSRGFNSSAMNSHGHSQSHGHSGSHSSSNNGAVLRDAKGDELETSAVHVSFISYQTTRLVTEESLRALYSKYGRVLDVSIKKSMIDRDIGRQSGYGFVHYELSKEGVVSAVAAAKELTDTTIEDVNYKSSISHSLKKFIHCELDAAPAPASAPAPALKPRDAHTPAASPGLHGLAHSSAGPAAAAAPGKPSAAYLYNAPPMHGAPPMHTHAHGHGPHGHAHGHAQFSVDLSGGAAAGASHSPQPPLSMHSQLHLAHQAQVYGAAPPQPQPQPQQQQPQQQQQHPSYVTMQPMQSMHASPVTNYVALPPGVFLAAPPPPQQLSAVAQNLSPPVYYATTLQNLPPMMPPMPPMPGGGGPSPAPSPSSPSRTLSQDSYREEFNRFMVSSLVSPLTYYHSPAAIPSSPLVVQTAPLFPTVLLSADHSYQVSPQQSLSQSLDGLSLHAQHAPHGHATQAEQILQQRAGLSMARSLAQQPSQSQAPSAGARQPATRVKSSLLRRDLALAATKPSAGEH